MNNLSTAVPVTTADSVQASVAPVDSSRLVTSVIETVQSHPDVHPSRAASLITAVLAGLYQAQPAIFAVSRASGRTQAQVSLGLGLAEVLVGALLRRPS